MTTQKQYSEKEEKINIISHAFGFIMSCVAFVLLVLKTKDQAEIRYLMGASIFGLSMMILYAASTRYHSATEDKFRFKMKILDHSAIYVLIAGTYTPYYLISLDNAMSTKLLISIWSMAAIGITIKLFFTGRFNKISTAMYILMGWSIVFVAEEALNILSAPAFYLLLVGGLAYSFGAIIYSIKKIPYNHAIFHIFVLIGTFSHFLSLYLYVL